MTKRDDQADAKAIGAVATALKDWEDTTRGTASLKPLREAVWFYWQGPRLPRPRVRGKYAKGLQWSAAARKAFGADGNTRLVIEHAEPMTLLLRQLIKDAPLAGDALRKRLAGGLNCVVVTPEEDRMITRAGFRGTMPSGWQPGDDPWARHRASGIPVEEFAPLEPAFAA